MTPTSVRVGVPPAGTLAGTYQPGAVRSDFAVVWVHGFGSHHGGEKAQAVRDECTRRGWAFAAFDFRGHGESSGAMHELRASRLLEDLAAVRIRLAHIIYIKHGRATHPSVQQGPETDGVGLVDSALVSRTDSSGGRVAAKIG